MSELATVDIEALVRHLYPSSLIGESNHERERLATCPWCDVPSQTLRLNIGTSSFACDECRSHGNALVLVQKALDCKSPAGFAYLREHKFLPELPASNGIAHRVTQAIGGHDGVSLLTVRASAVRPQGVRWLWGGRIPRGKITLLVGDPGSGKSMASCDLAARLTTGRSMPGDTKALIEPCDVLILNFEDGIEDTIVPRLIASLADLDRVHIMEAAQLPDGRRRIFNLCDLGAIEAKLAERPNIRALIIDPMGGAMAGVDSHKDAETRSALAPLANLAEGHDISVLCVAHLNKAESQKAVYRIGGSIAFIGLPRSVLLFARDEEQGRSVCASLKSNLGPMPPSLEYRAVDNHIEWAGVANTTAADLLAPPQHHERGRPPQSRTIAESFILEQIAHGKRLATDIRSAAERAGIPKRTLERASHQLQDQERLFVFKGGYGEGWYWSPTPRTVEAPHAALRASALIERESSSGRHLRFQGVDRGAQTQ